jgi:hypothetical protein
VGQSIGIKIVVKRVVAVLRAEADFDIVVSPAVTVQDFLDLGAEASFDFENQSANPLIFVARGRRESAQRKGTCSSSSFRYRLRRRLRCL